ncbi:MAG: ATP-dependent sacrificial sulfur transferase LarE [Armatimonadetes bacterium]|nr:ATP-dependent sacrificial sulfur transferase LarE [Armatimonadota bacterium]
MTPDLQAKYARLQAILREMGAVVIGLSGGVDSTLLVKVAYDTLGERCLAVIGKSEAFPEGEIDEALQLAQHIGVRVRIVPTHELHNPLFQVNRPDRCYHCKTELYERLGALARARGVAAVFSGANADDLGDWRPGLRAAAEHGVRHPLVEAGLGKEAVRAVARRLGLPSADKPATPCLASRVPFGTPVEPDVLARIDRAEGALRALGFRERRVRHLGSLGRVELAAEELPVALARRGAVERAVRAAGYERVEIDPEPLRSGRFARALRLREEPEGAAGAGEIRPPRAAAAPDR